MGLAGPRKRQKISHDPNNTHWSSNTNTFGHRMLASQGWAPGQTLGRKNATHASYFTKASASHVRVALREDNLGLGAKLGSGQGPGECTGLDSFQDLLGRLNGKSETIIEKERQGRASVNRIIYAERKYGGWSRFVSAGYLVGGDIMLDQLDTSSTAGAGKAAIISEHELASEATDIERKSERQDKKSKKRRAKESTDAGNVTTPTKPTDDDDEDSKSKRKAEKAQKRAAKAQRKEDRAKRRQEKAMALATVGSKSNPAENSSASLPQSIPSVSVSATPLFTSGRHAVRQRYIMQKKAAMLDSKALNEILMVKV